MTLITLQILFVIATPIFMFSKLIHLDYLTYCATNFQQTRQTYHSYSNSSRSLFEDIIILRKMPLTSVFLRKLTIAILTLSNYLILTVTEKFEI